VARAPRRAALTLVFWMRPIAALIAMKTRLVGPGFSPRPTSGGRATEPRPQGGVSVTTFSRVSAPESPQTSRRRVVALYKREVGMPSDYQGVLYVELDAAGGWRARLKS
jgi:hypothetical protein